MKKAQTKARKKKTSAAPVAIPDSLRLNLGAGGTEIPGFIALDKRTGHTIYPLPYPDNSVDEIRASHVLEHFPHGLTGSVIKDWARALKPGGRMRIAVPDFLKIAADYIKGVPFDIQGFVHGAQDYPENTHHAAFDEETLRETMVRDGGLERLQHWTSEIRDCATLEYSLNIEGYKPTTEDMRVKGVFAVAALARFGPSMHHKCTDEGLAMLGIPRDVMVGCYWYKNISNKMQDHLNDPGVEFILTLDYDTIFSPLDVLEMYRLMRAYPEADAIIPVQMKRTNDYALFNIINADGTPKRTAYAAEFDRNLVQVGTGHFGLTLYRAEKLRQLPKPWMTPKPNASGEWHDGDIEPDIDFWLNWRKAGFTAYLAPRVGVGHIEELIVWCGPGFAPIYQSVTDYFTNGKPAEARII